MFWKYINVVKDELRRIDQKGERSVFIDTQIDERNVLLNVVPRLAPPASLLRFLMNARARFVTEEEAPSGTGHLGR